MKCTITSVHHMIELKRVFSLLQMRKIWLNTQLIATICLLDRRAFLTSIGTIYTAITSFWFKNAAAFFALVKILTGIPGHNFFFPVAAFGTGDD